MSYKKKKGWIDGVNDPQLYWSQGNKKKIPNEKEQVIELEFYLSKFAFANGAEHTNIRNP